MVGNGEKGREETRRGERRLMGSNVYSGSDGGDESRQKCIL